VNASPTAAQDEAPEVRSLSFSGVVSVSESSLKSVLATRESSRLPWGTKYPFDQVRFDADLRRIVAFYADRGFPRARVTGVDIDRASDGGSVALTVRVDEGAPVRVAAVRFVGFDVLPPDSLARLQNDAPIETGSPRDRQVIAVTRELAVSELRDHGYPSARVSADEVEDPSGDAAEVTFTAEPGALAYFGAVEVVGNTSVGRRVIERQLLFEPGDLYRRSAVRESQRGLYGLALFQFANIETQVAEENPQEVRTRVVLVEGRHQRVNFGVGYGTEEKWRVSGSYRHVNFFGGARTAVVDARWSSLDRGLRGEFHQPYFFDPCLALSGEAQRWNTFTPTYTSGVTGARTTVTYQFNSRMLAALSFVVESTTSTITDEALNDPTLYDDLIAIGLDPTTNEQSGTLAPLAIELQRSTTDNVLDPTRGYQVGLRVEQAGGIVPSDFHYVSVQADGRFHVPVGERLVLAQRLQLATISEEADDPANVPFSKRLFLGGATSIRGWGRFEVSPLSSGQPIGGQTLLAFSAEARASLGARIGGVLFLDAGNVWLDEWTIALDELRYAAGIGLRYNTPVGPIRFDFGYQLNPIDGLLVNGEPESRRYRLHFSIGQAF
jgi:outer membrane protein assembly complex protein YaeT